MKKEPMLRLAAIVGALTVGTAHAGIVASWIEEHNSRKAAAAAEAASAVGLARPAPAQTAQNAAVNQVIERAQKTHAAAQAIVSHELSNGQRCAELVHSGFLRFSTLTQYKCILSGPPPEALAAEAAAKKAVAR